MIKYVIHAKKWRDKINGNTYHSAQILNTENKDMGAGHEYTRKLLESGEFEKIKDMYGNIGLRRIPK